MVEQTPNNLRGLGAGFLMGRASKNQSTLDSTISRLEEQVASITKSLGMVDSAARQASGGRSGKTSGDGSHRPSSHRADTPPRTFGASETPGGARKANGGGWTFGAASGGGAHSAAPPTFSQRADGAVAAAGGIGKVAAGLAVGGAYAANRTANTFNLNHANSMVTNEAISSQASYTSNSIKDGTYRNMFGNHYSATSNADLSSASSAFANQSGFSGGSSQYRKAYGAAASTSVIDPSISNTQAVQAAMSLGSPTTFNRMQAMGIRTMNRDGSVDPTKIAADILAKMPGSKNVKTSKQIDAAFGPAGSITQTIQSFVSNGLLPPDAVDTVVAQIRGLLKAQIAGVSAQEFGSLIRTAESNSGNARGDAASDKLNSFGVKTSEIANQRSKEGLGRDSETETVGGFMEMLETTTDVTKKFREMLNSILELPAVGELLGGTAGAKAGGIPGLGFLGNFSPLGIFGGDGPANLSAGAAMYGGAVGAGAGSGSSFAGSTARSSANATSPSAGSSGSAKAVTSSYSLGAVKPWVAKAADVMGKKFGIRTIGGIGSRPGPSDHPKGLALDFMCSSNQGNPLSAYAVANAGPLNITYVIWQQRIWSVNNPSWKRMEDRGSETANHFDHVHVSFLASPVNADLGGLSSGGGNGAQNAGAGDSTNGDSQNSPNNGTSFAGSSSGGGIGSYTEMGALGLGGGAGVSTGGGGQSSVSDGGASLAGGVAGSVPNGARIGSSNLDWSRGNDKKQLKYLAQSYDILMLQEANKTKLADVLPKGWKSNQNTTNSGTMGSAIAWNADKLGDNLGQSGMDFGSNQKGGNTRFISYVDSSINGQQVRLISGHYPLKKYADPKIFEANLRKVIDGRPEGSEWMIGADGNSLWKGMGKRLGGAQDGAGVVGQIRSKGLRTGGATIDTWGMRQGLTDHQYVGQSISAQAPKNVSAGVGGTPAQNRALGQQMAAAMGWGKQWDALNSLWTKESGWRTDADNPSSSAYGIPQSLPGSKMASAGKDWMDNPATQIQWGLNYIKQRYGDPSGAWGHSQKTGWYAAGEWNIRDDQPARVHKGEMILPAKVAEAVRNELTAPNGFKNSGGSGIVFQPGSVVVSVGAGTSKKESMQAGEWVVEAIMKDNRIKALAGGE